MPSCWATRSSLARVEIAMPTQITVMRNGALVDVITEPSELVAV